jgi:isopentenyl diphosphate isomerase/L-lactate dehydrogenase-like FMN-dependent dehydrogenase
MVFDFIDGAAEDEVTMRRNRRAFSDVEIVPQPLVDVGQRDQRVMVLGRELPSPLILGPAGLAGVAWPGGEATAARAAGERGLPFVLSTAGSASIEDVARSSCGPLWFQLYLWRDRDVTHRLVERAETAGYETLCLTVDVPMSGQRERDLRHGFVIPPAVSVRNMIDVVRHPAWARRVLGGPPVTFGNFVDSASDRGDDDVVTLGQIVNAQLNPTATWDDVAWLRHAWPGSLVLKGILDPEAARRAVDAGADGVVVSNHGGRQLDGAPATIDVLPDVADAVGGCIEVLVDGGVRRGVDVVRALGLGARACLIARPYLYGLAAAGEAGVLRAVDVMIAEVDRVMALSGLPTLDSRRLASIVRRRSMANKTPA